MGEEQDEQEALICFRVVFVAMCLIVGGAMFGDILFYCISISSAEKEPPVPVINIASMDFTLLNNITQSRRSAKWDLSIRIPYDLPRRYICSQGNFQASFLYHNITLATSSSQRYQGLKSYEAQILEVSAVVSEEDIAGLIGERIIRDIEEKKEVPFGSQFSLTDCREKSKGVMRYVCDEATLRFEPGSEMMKATLFGNQPTCINV